MDEDFDWKPRSNRGIHGSRIKENIRVPTCVATSAVLTLTPFQLQDSTREDRRHEDVRVTAPLRLAVDSEPRTPNGPRKAIPTLVFTTLLFSRLLLS